MARGHGNNWKIHSSSFMHKCSRRSFHNMWHWNNDHHSCSSWTWDTCSFPWLLERSSLVGHTVDQVLLVNPLYIPMICILVLYVSLTILDILYSLVLEVIYVYMVNFLWSIYHKSCCISLSLQPLSEVLQHSNEWTVPSIQSASDIGME